MKEWFQFGKRIPGLEINGKPAPYPVVNEREVRAGAGVMFVIAAIGMANGFFVHNFAPLKIIVVFFFIDFFIRVFFGTTLSPSSAIGRLFIFNQTPEWVGAAQKRLAWSIGLVMSSIMIVLLHVLDVRGAINLSVCFICLVFMWLESACGICVGCIVYKWLGQRGYIKSQQYAPACAGGVCEINKK